MDAKDFIKKRNFYQSEIKKFEKRVSVEYTKTVKEFLKENSPVATKKVYELVENGIKRKGYKRFVIYTQDVKMFDKHVLIIAGGWWLNENNITSKWDSMAVFGVGNPAKFVLSQNQIHQKHPDSK